MASLCNLRSLDIVLTSRCNLACSYCYQNDKSSTRMDWPTLQAALDLLLSSRRDEVELLFIGGEPLLEFDLIRRAVAYSSANRRENSTVRYSVVTNGTRADPEIIDFLIHHRFEVQLSFDGVASAQAFRGESTFPKLDRLLTTLRARNADWFQKNLSVSMTLHTGGLVYLADSVRYFLDKDVRELAIAPVFTHDAGWRAERIRELDEAFALVFEDCERHYRRTGSIPLSLFRKKKRSGGCEPSVPDGMCGVTRGETLTVDSNGEVHGCVTFADSYQNLPTPFAKDRLEPLRLGSVASALPAKRLPAFETAARNAEIFSGRSSKYSSYRKCSDCEYVSVCAVCPMSIAHIPGNEDPHRIPDFLCAFNLVVGKYRDRFPEEPSALDFLMGDLPLPEMLQELQDFVDT